MNIPTNAKHLFIKGRTKDEVFDLWVGWFERKRVPYLVATERKTGRRILYKHQTRVVSGEFAPCCAGFDEVVEGRSLAVDNRGRKHEKNAGPACV
ncbi:MAG: hypothetical protein ACYS4W_14810 [Planctomycetota bacterium]